MQVDSKTIQESSHPSKEKVLADEWAMVEQTSKHDKEKDW